MRRSVAKNPDMLGKPTGRPPVHHTDEEVHALGEELIAWLIKRKNERKPVFHLTEWYILEKNMLFKEWDSLRNRTGFVHYYENALQLMTLFTISNDKLPTAYGSRFLGIYSSEIREHEEGRIKFEADVNAAAKAKEVNNITEQEILHNQAIIDGILRLQQVKQKEVSREPND